MATVGGSGSARMARRARMPSSGARILMSSRATSGWYRRATSTADLPSEASPTISMSWAPDIIARSPERTSSSSSANMSLINEALRNSQ